jgi:hypothetical protein
MKTRMVPEAASIPGSQPSVSSLDKQTGSAGQRIKLLLTYWMWR